MQIFKKDLVLQTSKDVNSLTSDFENYLKNSGWKTQSRVESDQAILQATKAGFLRDVIAADRALTFVFKENAGNVEVHVGVGKLGRPSFPTPTCTSTLPAFSLNTKVRALSAAITSLKKPALVACKIAWSLSTLLCVFHPEFLR